MSVSIEQFQPPNGSNIYRIYRFFELKIAGFELEKKALVRERDIWIRKSGPKEVHGQRYDLDIKGITIYATDPEVLEKIDKLTREIIKCQEIIEGWELSFSEYKTRIRQTRKDLEEHGCPDTTLIVFDEAFLKRKTNEQVAKDNFIPLNTVFNKKTEINKLMQSN